MAITQTAANKARSKRSPGSGRASGTNVLAVTRDGVRILRPRGKPTHFTVKQLRAAIRAVRQAAPVG